MVTLVNAVPAWLVLAAEEGEPLIRRLEPAMRAKVLAALAGLVILGLGMVLLAWLGSRAVRRYMKGYTRVGHSPPPSVPPQDDWARRPLAGQDDERASEGP